MIVWTKNIIFVPVYERMCGGTHRGRRMRPRRRAAIAGSSSSSALDGDLHETEIDKSVAKILTEK